jgi:hypothetical protein
MNFKTEARFIVSYKPGFSLYDLTVVAMIAQYFNNIIMGKSIKTRLSTVQSAH